MSLASRRSSAGTAASLLEVVDVVYRSVLDTRQRDRIPRLVGGLVDGDLTGLWCFSTDSRHVHGRGHGDERKFGEYMQDWVGRDEVIHEALTVHQGTTVDMAQVLDARPSLRSSAAFEGFYDRHDLANATGHFRSIAPGWIGGVAVLRGHRKGPYPQAEQSCLRRLAPHLQRALSLSLRLETLELRSVVTDRLLADRCLTMVACTRDGRVLDHTPRAETALRSRKYGLGLRHGRLTADDHDSEARLRSALEYAGRGQLPLSEIALRARDRSIVWCTVLPLTQAEQSVAGEPHDCLVLLHVPGDRDLIRAERVARSLQISPAEGDVLAGLMRGEAPAAIAARRDCSVETVRAYEKSMRQKLDCHSRAALVATAWRTLAAIPSPVGLYGHDH